MKRKGKIIMSVMLCIVLFAAMFVVPVFTNVIEPVSENVRAEGEELDFPLPPDEPTPPPLEVHNLTLSNISAFSLSDYPQIIFVNTPAYVNVTFSNKGENYISDVTVDVYEVRYNYRELGGNMSQEPYTEIVNYLTTLSYANFLPAQEKTETVPWTPTQTGEHELRLNISYNERSRNVVYEDRATFCIARNDLPIIEMDEDWIIDGNVTMENVTIIVNGDLLVTETGNLTLRGCYLSPLSIDIWGIDIWVDVSVNVQCLNRGDDHLWVHETGTLLVKGSEIFNFPPLETYHFYVDGILRCMEYIHPITHEFKRTIIRNVWGEDSGSIERGGIELRNNNPAKQSSFTYTAVKECDTIGIGCYGSSSLIGPYVLVQWCGSSYGSGKGIYVEGATANPTIEYSWFGLNSGDFGGTGIKLKNSASANIHHNLIWSNTHAGVFCDSSSSFTTIEFNFGIIDHYYGILCKYSSPTIIGNGITYNSYGILGEYSSPTIENNLIGSNTYGIWAHFSSATILFNTISDNYWGILLSSAPSVTVVDNNVITSNNIHGIWMIRSSATIQNNQIYENDYLGIYMGNSIATIQNNQIDENGYLGIYMGLSSATIQDNVLSENGWLSTDDRGGIYGYRSTPTIIGNTFNANKGWAIWMNQGAPTNEPTIGTDNDYTSTDVGRVWQQWWLRVLVKDDNGVPIPGASVDVYDFSGTPVFSGSTGPDGMTDEIIVTEYQIDVSGNPIPYTPHRIEVTSPPPGATEWVTVDDNLVALVLLPL